MRNNRCA